MPGAARANGYNELSSHTILEIAAVIEVDLVSHSARTDPLVIRPLGLPAKTVGDAQTDRQTDTRRRRTGTGKRMKEPLHGNMGMRSDKAAWKGTAVRTRYETAESAIS